MTEFEHDWSGKDSYMDEPNGNIFYWILAMFFVSVCIGAYYLLT